MVLERYGLALCFLEVFEWWYFSGTPEVRMRYAHKFRCSGQLFDFTSQMIDLRKGVKRKSINDIGTFDFL